MVSIECVALFMNSRSVGFFLGGVVMVIGRIERGSYGGWWPKVVVGH